MDQAAIDTFLQRYRHLPPEDLAALGLRRGELVPEAIAALEIVLKDTATQEQIAGVADQVEKAIAPHAPGFGISLGFLFVCLLAYGPIQFLSLYVFFHVEELVSPSLLTQEYWPDFKWANGVLSALLTIVSLFAAMKLYRHRRRKTIRIVILCLWIIGPLEGFFQITLVDLLFSRANAIWVFSTEHWDERLVWTFFMATIWTTYLLVSRRVKAVYPAATN